MRQNGLSADGDSTYVWFNSDRARKGSDYSDSAEQPFRLLVHSRFKSRAAALFLWLEQVEQFAGGSGVGAGSVGGSAVGRIRVPGEFATEEAVRFVQELACFLAQTAG